MACVPFLPCTFGDSIHYARSEFAEADSFFLQYWQWLGDRLYRSISLFADDLVVVCRRSPADRSRKGSRADGLEAGLELPVRRNAAPQPSRCRVRHRPSE